MNPSPAKQLERALKFCGHEDEISEKFETLLTPASWVDVKFDVILAMMSDGDGLLVPFVPSAQTKDLLPSNWLTRE